MFILNDMDEADVVEVIDIVVDEAENEGGVEGEAGHQLLQQLSVSTKRPVPAQDHDKESKTGMISWWNDPVKNNLESCKTVFCSWCKLCLLHQQLSSQNKTFQSLYLCCVSLVDQISASP